jgi:type 1 glutamine amidotransferase
MWTFSRAPAREATTQRIHQHMTRVLYLYGGWPGHLPYEVAGWANALMDDLGFEVEETNDPHRLEEDLTVYDLIVIGWTQAATTEDLSERAEQRLHEAVRGGTGLAGWHGMAASFRSSLQFSLIAGASFLEHPGGEGVPVPYTIDIVDRDHPITQGVESFRIASEQYYMHVDPSVHVLATTTFSGEHLPWLDGVVMPAVYTRRWGDGRVFYASPGHAPDELRIPEAERLVRQGLQWAARR